MQLSIVTTLFRSAPHLLEFHRRVSAAAAGLTSAFEIIFVNDGSPDDSQAVALALAHSDPRVSVVELSRNFGHHKAIMTGLARASGAWVFLIDCDLEEQPELLTRFWREVHETDSDVVYGVQTRRKGGWFERVSGQVFYWLINILSTYPIPPNLVTVRLMRQRYVRSLVEHRDQELFMAGLWAITGYRQRPLAIDKLSLNATTYSLAHKANTFVNAVTSFSTKPLIFIFYLGCLISVGAGAIGSYLLIRRIFFGHLLEGWVSLMVSLWFLGGITLFSLGVIGIYLSKIFIETKPRPYTIVRSVEGRQATPLEH